MSTVAVLRPASDEECGVSPAAVRYAAEQLSVRAGVSHEEFCRWHVDFSEPGYVDLYVQPGTRKRLRFPRMGLRTWGRIEEGVFHTSTAQWPMGNSGCKLTRDFKIPFSSSGETAVGPLFVRQTSDCFRCPVDLLSSIVLSLVRFEETLPTPRDIHGRFTAYASVAWRDGFLQRPVVDEYGMAFEQVLKVLLPGWKPVERVLRVKLSHDVDEIGIPFSFRSAVAKTVRHGHPLLTLLDLAAPLLSLDNSDRLHLKRLVQLSLTHGLDSALYWKTSRQGPYDTGYDLDDRRIRRLIHTIEQAGVEMGIHPSYETFLSPVQLHDEVEKLRALFGSIKLGGRQHYLRWDPQSWARWDAIGLAYDSSVGFADYVGFRAGTCIPYRPWLWSENCCAGLVEIPLLATDSTLRGYMKLSASQALAVLRSLVDRCREVGGVFTLAWHNTALLDSRYSETYRLLLEDLTGSPKFEWRTAAA